jgi:hypothetical protein
LEAYNPYQRVQGTLESEDVMAGALRIPGLPSAASGLLGPVNTQARATLPDIVELDPADARPSICLVGGSGTGKTTQIRNVIRAGFNVLVVAIESKLQAMAGERPLVVNMNEPVREGSTFRAATVTDKYNRLLAFRDALKEGKYRSHKGKPIDVIAFDGAMEMGAIIKGHKLKSVIVSKSGETNTFKTFDEIGIDLIDFFAACREAASDASKAFGVPPVGIIVTCGEQLKDGEYKPILPGNQAALMLPYQFEAVLRLTTEINDGNLEYVAYSTPGETAYPLMGRWTAKAPGGLFEGGKIVNPDLGKIYKQLVNYYQGNKENELEH